MMNAMPTKTFNTLRAWRRDKGLNQREAAHILRLSQTTYSRIERGVRFPKPKVLKRLVKKTGVSIERLLEAAS